MRWRGRRGGGARGGGERSEAAASLPSFTRFSSHDAETLDRSF